MWKNAKRTLPTIKKLLPELTSLGTLELSTTVEHIYKKYFDAKVNDVARSSPSLINSCLQLNVTSNLPTPPAPSNDDVWIFGYGSLVWKADFPYIDRRRGFICGFQRRFYQHSIDHRGTPTQPGRVVTLLPTGLADDRVYGVAYRIAAHQKDDVLQHLDYREKNGYERCQLTFQEFPETSGGHFDIIMYVATHQNDSYAGEVWQLPRIAEQIFTSAGPSGPNRDYLFNLAHAMRELFPGVQDAHLYELEQELQQLIDSTQAATLERALKKQIGHILTNDAQNANLANGVDDEAAMQQFETLQRETEQAGWRESLLTKELLLLPPSLQQQQQQQSS